MGPPAGLLKPGLGVDEWGGIVSVDVGYLLLGSSFLEVELIQPDMVFVNIG